MGDWLPREGTGPMWVVGSMSSDLRGFFGSFRKESSPVPNAQLQQVRLLGLWGNLAWPPPGSDPQRAWRGTASWRKGRHGVEQIMEACGGPNGRTQLSESLVFPGCTLNKKGQTRVGLSAASAWNLANLPRSVICGHLMPSFPWLLISPLPISNYHMPW